MLGPQDAATRVALGGRDAQVGLGPFVGAQHAPERLDVVRFAERDGRVDRELPDLDRALLDAAFVRHEQLHDRLGNHCRAAARRCIPRGSEWRGARAVSRAPLRVDQFAEVLAQRDLRARNRSRRRADDQGRSGGIEARSLGEPGHHAELPRDADEATTTQHETDLHEAPILPLLLDRGDNPRR